MEVIRRSANKALKLFLAFALAIGAVSAEALASTKQAWANSTEGYMWCFDNSEDVTFLSHASKNRDYFSSISGQTVYIIPEEYGKKLENMPVEMRASESNWNPMFSKLNVYKSTVTRMLLDDSVPWASHRTALASIVSDAPLCRSVSLDNCYFYDSTTLFVNMPQLDTVSLNKLTFAHGLTSLFENCSALNKVIFTSPSTLPETTSRMFAECNELASIEGLSLLLNDSLSSTSEMFLNCSSLESLDLSSWTAASVEDMSGMFKGCSKLQSLDLSGLKATSIGQTSDLFANCTSLRTVNLPDSCSNILGALLPVPSPKTIPGATGKWLDENGIAYAPADIPANAGGIYVAQTIQPLQSSWIQPIASMTATGSALTPSVVLKDGDVTLRKGTDYTVSYQNNVQPGTATVIITGIGAYEGTLTTTFAILEKPGAGSDKPINPSKPTDPSQPSTPGGSDKPSNPSNPGGSSATKPGAGNSSSGNSGSSSTKVPNEVTPGLSDITVSGTAPGGATSGGTAGVAVGSRPGISIVISGKELVEGVDYVLSYVGGTTVGNATVIIKGLGNNKWVKSIQYVVLPPSTTVSKTTLGKKSTQLAWRKQASQTDGYQVRYSAKKSMKGAKTKTVKGAKKASAKLPRVKTGKSLYVQVRTYKKVGGKTYYSPWSAKTRVSNPPATSISKLKKAKRGFTVKWKKQPKRWTTGYQVRWSTKKSMKGAKKLTVKGASKTSLKVSKLKGGKKYYVQVRTYKKMGKKTYYSAWSKAKAVKTKK